MDHLVLQNAVGVDDEQSAKRQVATFDEYAICLADFAVGIARQWERERPDAALRRRRGQPTHMRVDRVRADRQHIAMPFTELRESIAHGGQFSRTDEREIARVEHQQEPAVKVIVESSLAAFRPRPVDHGQGESRRSDSYFGFACHGRWPLPWNDVAVAQKFPASSESAAHTARNIYDSSPSAAPEYRSQFRREAPSARTSLVPFHLRSN